MPPTGAQGLNTSVEDIIYLYQICKKALKSNKDIGEDKLLINTVKVSINWW